MALDFMDGTDGGGNKVHDEQDQNTPRDNLLSVVSDFLGVEEDSSKEGEVGCGKSEKLELVDNALGEGSRVDLGQKSDKEHCKTSNCLECQKAIQPDRQTLSRGSAGMKVTARTIESFLIRMQDSHMRHWWL